MGKRKDGDDELTKPVDLASSDPEFNHYPISKHRSCWVHVVGSYKAGKKKITKQEAQKIWDFKLTAPCLLANIPFRQRSKRRINRKNLLSKHKESPTKTEESGVVGTQGGDWITDSFDKKHKEKLDSGTFECYLEYMWSSLPEDKRTSFACIDCQWFEWYRKASSREKVLSWIKRKQILSKKYVLVPIVCWSHWSLLIFCNFGENLQSKTRTPCMLLLDSLKMANPGRLEPDIRKFVFDIYKAEGRPEKKEMISRIPLLVPKVPQQRDDKECGNYVLYFINLFVESAPKNFSLEDYPYFMRTDWFNAEGLEHFCRRLIPLGSDFS